MSLKELRRHILAIDTFTMTDDELRTAHSAARAAAAAVRPQPPPSPIVIPKAAVVDADEYYHPHAADNWSSNSAFAIDDAVFSQIDFTRPQAPVPTHYRHAQPADSMKVDNDPFALAQTSSRSSSSGDISLPPTPEFNPADKTTAVVPVPRWNLGGKAPPQPDLLHVNLPSPLSSEFALYTINQARLYPVSILAP